MIGKITSIKLNADYIAVTVGQSDEDLELAKIFLI